MFDVYRYNSTVFHKELFKFNSSEFLDCLKLLHKIFGEISEKENYSILILCYI